MDLIHLIEQSAPMVWMREGGSLLGYPFVLFLHTVGLATVAGVSGAVALRILGFGNRIPLPALVPAFQLIRLALIVTVVSGLILLFADATTKLASPVFYVKMVFVAAAVVLGRRLRQALNVPAAPAATVRPARGLALAALACWVAAITAGRLIAYLGPLQGIS